MCMCVNTGRQTEAGVNNMSQFRSKYNGRGGRRGVGYAIQEHVQFTTAIDADPDSCVPSPSSVLF